MDSGSAEAIARQVLTKAEALARAKRRAAWFLVGATGLFALSLVLRGVPAWMVDLLRSTSEAAMVGGLADWFAVAALFRPVTLLIPIFPAHTAVVPRNKDRIATSLGDFVRDHFLATDTLVAMVARHDPARFASRWLLEKENAEQLGRHGVALFSWALKSLQEEKIKALIGETIRKAFARVDLSKKVGELLEALLKEGRHHQLLDEAIVQLSKVLRDADMRAAIAAKISAYIQAEYPKAQLLLPTDLIGRFVSGSVADFIDRYLADVSLQPGHDMRLAFDRRAHQLIAQLKGDSHYARKGEELKTYILDNENFASYVASLWASIRDLIETDLQDADSTLQKKLVGAGHWLGLALEKDEVLRSSLNRRVEMLVQQFGPGLGLFVSTHIERTIRGWNAAAMSRLIEENIGTDLQKIRINGTLIGGLLGAALYGITRAAAVVF